MSEPLKVISLGAGVQSSALFLMACRGAMPTYAAAIFADTQWEPPEVYTWLDVLRAEGARAGIPVVTVTAGDLRADALRSRIRQSSRWLSMPVYVTTPGGGGIMRRQCTREYKIDPIKRELRRMLEERGLAKRPGCVRLDIGISLDEASRMKDSDVRWVVRHYPLIYDRQPPMRRSDCHAWIEDHGFESPARSACLGCPFHSDDEWRLIKSDPLAWADVTAFDDAIRHSDPRGGEVFLHRSLQPLSDVPLDVQTRIDWLGECEGACGV